MRTLFAIAAAILHSAILLACGPTDGSDGAELAGVSPDPERIPQTCSGSYACAGSTSATFTLVVSPGEDACLIRFSDGELAGLLEPGGVASWRGDPGAWKPTQSGFRVCFEDCVTCVSELASATGGGGCKGAATSCSAFSAGSCSAQKGCSLTSKVKYDGSLEYHCTGTPVGCSAMSSEQVCTGHSGCVWAEQ